ncbi:MAG TPA: hypothetical protein DCZ72_04660 [Armatimonadetes bacterium]|nr:hypothetical protein [Armatimonadota bacterium]
MTTAAVTGGAGDPAAGSLHTVGVGGLVVRGDGAVLLVRHTYGPSRGRLMLPGGHLEAGEALRATAVREVGEETGLACTARGVIAVRQRLDVSPPNLYFVFLLAAPTDATPVVDGVELDAAFWLTPAEALARDDLQPICADILRAWAADPRRELEPLPLDWAAAEDYLLWTGGAGPSAGDDDEPHRPGPAV